MLASLPLRLQQAKYSTLVKTRVWLLQGSKNSKTNKNTNYDSREVESFLFSQK